jgi:asparagine synthase (glutamine-hydrolysing)
MCGILFIAQDDTARVTPQRAAAALDRQRWRGPDAQRLLTLDGGRVHLGHNRLAVIDPTPRADQPMRSRCGRYTIVFNGEIYNFRALQRRHRLPVSTASDTEVLLEGIATLGERFIDELEGMFAFVLHDHRTGTWLAARDALGIKPLYVRRSAGLAVLASEPATVAWLTGAGPDAQSLQEWRLLRRPVPGRSFFDGIDELLPGHVLHSDGRLRRFWSLAQRNERFDEAAFDELLAAVVREHETSDVRNTALLSGGIDSTLIVALSQVPRTYTVGLPEANEFAAAAETAQALQRELVEVTLPGDALVERWRALTRLRGEPLALPNEALIHAACGAMAPDEKVVLTGEGADELMFGYDGLYRWALQAPRFDADEFLRRYGYADDVQPTSRISQWLGELAEGKTAIDAAEDFFYAFHLPGLLRRMDFASMAASKEARVPFADRRLVDFCYRAPAAARLNERESKIPLRRALARRGLIGPLNRRKIGFSTLAHPAVSRHDEYRRFQTHVLKELAWS